MTIIIHELKVNFKTFLIWSTTIGIMLFSCMIMFPMMKDSLTRMGDLYSNMEGVSAAFGLDKLSIYTAMGYYGTSVSIILTLGGALFTAMLGTGMLSKEEGGHTAEFLLSTPNSRSKIIFQKLVAMILIILAFDLFCIIFAALSFLLINESIELPQFLLYHIAQFSMHVEIACICFGISAFTRKVNVGIGLGIATILYFIDIMVRTISDLNFLKFITPFYYASASDIFASGKINGVLITIGILVCIISFSIGYIKYSKKDIAS